jgi:hypothetical protein
MNGLVTARSALRPQAGQIAVGKNSLIKNIQNPKSGTMCNRSCLKGSGNYRMNVALPEESKN